MGPIQRRALPLMIGFALAGLLLSVWGYREHYAVSGGACNVSQVFNCDLVNKSQYSTIAGVPVAAFGIGGYLLLLLLALAWARLRDPLLIRIYVLGAVAGLAFALYLTYLEAFAIHAWCLICLASLSSIVGATASGAIAWREK